MKQFTYARNVTPTKHVMLHHCYQILPRTVTFIAVMSFTVTFACIWSPNCRNNTASVKHEGQLYNYITDELTAIVTQ